MLPAAPIQIGQRVIGLGNKKLLLPLLAFSQGLLTLTVILWPVAVLVRRRYQRPLFSAKGDRALYLFSRLICLLQIVFVALILLPLSMADKLRVYRR